MSWNQDLVIPLFLFPELHQRSLSCIISCSESDQAAIDLNNSLFSLYNSSPTILLENVHCPVAVSAPLITDDDSRVQFWKLTRLSKHKSRKADLFGLLTGSSGYDWVVICCPMKFKFSYNFPNNYWQLCLLIGLHTPRAVARWWLISLSTSSSAALPPTGSEQILASSQAETQNSTQCSN